MGKKAHKGVFITTSKFTTPASDFAQSTQTTIVLIDGPRLADLMTEHGIGVTTQHTYEVKRINTDYFTEE